MSAKILICSCEHEYQDKLYGKYHRVHNQTKKQDGQVWRCTVCSKERTEQGTKSKEE
jgi:hypothetical protein